MNNNFDSTVKVIAFAIERDTESLRELLRRNGMMTLGLSKDGLQRVVTTALSENLTFAKEFKDWSVARNVPTAKPYLNVTGPVKMWQQDSHFSEATAINEPEPTPAPAKSGLSVQTFLDFASTNFNTFATIKQSEAEKAIVKAAVERERLAQSTSITSGSDVKSKSNVVLYVGLCVGALAVITTVVYFVNKKK